jgi:hypothetical protein
MPEPSREIESLPEDWNRVAYSQSALSGIYGKQTAGVTASCINNSGLALTASVDGAANGTVNAELNSAEDVNLWSTVIETYVSASSIRRQQN